MIHAFNFTCHRDMDLSVLMRTTLMNHCKSLGRIYSHNTDTEEQFKGYGNGAGWTASMMKLNAMRDIVNSGVVQDTDFVLSVDSDVVFTSPEVFKYVKPEYGIIGIKHRPEYYTVTGKWSHMSGALIFFRGDIAKKMAALSDDELNNIRFRHFKTHNLTENEDVVLSYLAKYVGGQYFDLGTVPGLSSGDFEQTCLDEYNFWNKGICHDHQWASFYHLNYCPTQFLGETVNGKWDIPRILREQGIEL